MFSEIAVVRIQLPNWVLFGTSLMQEGSAALRLSLQVTCGSALWLCGRLCGSLGGSPLRTLQNHGVMELPISSLLCWSYIPSFCWYHWLVLISQNSVTN